MDEKEIKSYRRAGRIAKQVKEYAKGIIKKDSKLIDIAGRIEAKIRELGAEPAFPVNLCMDEVAAHYTPNSSDETKAHGLLKVDIGVHANGFIADTAFTIDLTENKEHSRMIKATEDSLLAAQKMITKDAALSQIGEAIHKVITSAGFSPVRNLSGHGLGEYQVHSGVTVPSYKNNNQNKIGQGAFAIEPFATTGAGLVYEGPVSSIYHIVKEGQARDETARKILKWIYEKKRWLPFSEREIEKEFGSRARVALSMLEKAGIIKSYAQLIEKSHKPVAQAENTIIIHEDSKVEVTTE